MKFLMGSKSTLGEGVEQDWAWSTFADWISTAVERTSETMAEFHAWPKDQQSAAKRADWIAGGRFTGGKRQLAALEGRTMFTLDIDECSPEALAAIEAGQTLFSDLTHCGHTTRSSTPGKPRLRLYLPTDAELDGETYRAAASGLCRILELLPGVKVDWAASTDPARLLYLPTLCSDAPHTVVNYSGSTPSTEWLIETWKAHPQPTAQQAQPQERAQEGPLQARRDVPAPDAAEDLDRRGLEAMRAAGAVVVPSPRRKGELTTNCPWHDDQSPSLDIAEDGKMVCRAGCKPDGRPITWLRYVAKVKNLREADAFRWVRRAFGLPESTLPPRVGAETFPYLADGQVATSDYNAPIRVNPWRLIPIADLPILNLKPEDRLWGDLITKGHVTVLAGQAGIGKSTLLRNIVAAISEGRPYLGRDAGRQARVVVADWETPEMFRRTFWEDAFGAERMAFGSPNVWSVDRPPSVSHDILDDLIQALIETQADLLVIDTLSAAFVVENENDNAEMESVARMLRKVAQAGPAVLVLAHPSKGGADIRGASAFTGAVDVVVTFKAETEIGMSGPDETSRFRLRVVKNRTGSMESEVIAWDGLGGFVAPEAPTEVELANSEEVVLAFITRSNGNATHRRILEDAAAQRVSNRTAKWALRKLRERGKIICPRRGFYEIKK